MRRPPLRSGFSKSRRGAEGGLDLGGVVSVVVVDADRAAAGDWAFAEELCAAVEAAEVGEGVGDEGRIAPTRHARVQAVAAFMALCSPGSLVTKRDEAVALADQTGVAGLGVVLHGPVSAPGEKPMVWTSQVRPAATSRRWAPLSAMKGRGRRRVLGGGRSWANCLKDASTTASRVP